MYSIQEKKDMRLAFWEQFRVKSGELRIRNRVGKKWLLHKTEIRGVQLRFSVTEEFAQVAIEIDRKSESERLELFERFESHKKGLEKVFGETLTWEPFYNGENLRYTSRIYCQASGMNILRPEQWDEILEFLISRMLKLEKAYLRHKEYFKDEPDESA